MNQANNTQWPLVSAIMLCYNQARFVVECLEAIKAQNYPNLELIINDDASRDDSAAVIQKWLATSTIPHRFLRSETNRGICGSLNTALSHAKGKYVSGIAADDAWLPGKLLRQVELLERLPEKVGVVYSDALLMDERGNLLPQKFMESGHRDQHLSAMPQGDVQTALWQTNFIPPMTTLVRRACYQRAGDFDESLFAEDWDMWLRISRWYEFVYSPEIAAKYRMVGTSASNGQFVRLADDMCRTCVKHLRSSELEPKARKAAATKLSTLARVCFEQKSPRYKQNLRDALRYQPSPRIVLRCLFAWSGLGPEGFQRVRGLGRKPRLQAG
jgi:cellulose synthase/poly-beta-1,6-N-acetylglucosamine synthase-like glycosyltransferase